MSAHPSSSLSYVLTFAALLFLTIVTVTASYFDLGSLNIPIAIGIATLKMCVVSLFFMGLRFEKGFNSFIFVGSFACVIIFLLFTFSDIAFRGTITEKDSIIFDIKSPVKKMSHSSGHSNTHTKDKNEHSSSKTKEH